jgi:hypothetical protein
MAIRPPRAGPAGLVGCRSWRAARAAPPRRTPAAAAGLPGRRDATALQIEQLLGLQATHGGAVGTLHIVGHDLQLRLGVDAGAIGEQQAAAELGRIGALGGAGNPHGAVEHAAGLVVGHRLVQLIELALRTVEAHPAVGVGKLAIPAHLQAPQAGEGRAGRAAGCGAPGGPGPSHRSQPCAPGGCRRPAARPCAAAGSCRGPRARLPSFSSAPEPPGSPRSPG